jgi:multiple sugar transport system permease protein
MGALLGSRKARQKIFTLLFSAAVFLIGLIMITPFIFMISASFKYPGQVFVEPLRIIPSPLFLGNFQRVFADRMYFGWYLNSIRVVLITIPLRGFFVALAAYAFARLRFRGRNILFLCCIATMMITPEVTIIPRYLLYKSMGITDTHWAIILPATFDIFFLFMLRQFFMTIPKELSEAALIDGYGHFRIFYRIVLPLAKPALVTMVLFTFIWLWNDYVNPFVFITSMKRQLVTVGLQFFQAREGANYALQMAGATIAVLPTVFMFTFTQKYFIQGLTSSGIKG